MSRAEVRGMTYCFPPHELWDSHWSERRSLSRPPSSRAAIVSATPLIGYSRVAGISRSHDESANRPSPMKPYRESLWPRASHEWLVWPVRGAHGFLNIERKRDYIFRNSSSPRFCNNPSLFTVQTAFSSSPRCFNQIANHPSPITGRPFVENPFSRVGERRKKGGDRISILINRLW